MVETVPQPDQDRAVRIRKSVREIADLIGGEIAGNPEAVITGFAGIKEAKPGELTFLAGPKYEDCLKTTEASGVIVSRGVEDSGRTLIRVDNPFMAFVHVVDSLISERIPRPVGIHPSAVVGKNVKLGEDVAIHAQAVIEDNASLGDRVVLYPGVYVGHETEIGEDSIIYPNVTIRERVSIGKRVIIHSNVSIGCDGFGFAPDKGNHHKVPQIGTVVIEDDVEIGANSSVDRATLGVTRIGKGTKIDNLVQVAHNVQIGENCILCAQVGIAGSTVIEDDVMMAGQVGVTGHICIGKGSKVGAKSGVSKNVPAETFVSGIPATRHDKELKIEANLRRLPKMREELRSLKQRLTELEAALRPTSD